MPCSRTNNKSLRKLNRFSFRFIKGKIDFHSRYNSSYKDEELLASLIYLSIRNRYPENGMPDADTFYIRLGKKSMQEIRKDREIIVLIDEHEIPWFGESNEYVGTKNFHGTKFCFKYITINALIEAFLQIAKY